MIHVKPIINSPWGPIGEKLRSNKDISKGRQQAAASDGLILEEPMHTPLKGGSSISGIGSNSVRRSCRSQEAERCLPSGETGGRRIGSHADQRWGNEKIGRDT